MQKGIFFLAIIIFYIAVCLSIYFAEELHTKSMIIIKQLNLEESLAEFMPLKT